MSEEFEGLPELPSGSRDEQAAPATAALASEDDPFYGKDCPLGMVQVEFVGVDPELRHGRYGYKPSQTAFLEIYVDGQRFRIDVGSLKQYAATGDDSSRGIHINFPLGATLRDRSLNALSIALPAPPAA